jgi:cobalt-zinc-cadmium efflux system membrane fusion protein
MKPSPECNQHDLPLRTSFSACWRNLLCAVTPALVFAYLAQAATAGTAESSITNAAVELSPQSARFVEIAAIGPRTNQAWGRAISGRVSIPGPARINVGVLVDGRVEEVMVRPGDKVEAGARLLRIQSAGGGQSRAEAETAAARLKAAEENFRRYTEMVIRGVGTEVERLEAEARLREAKIDAERTRSAVSLLGDGSDLQMFVVAPTNGFVIKVEPALGSVVKAGDEVVEIGDPARVWIEAEVSEDDAAAIRHGQCAAVESLRGGRSATAKVEVLTAQIDPATRRRRVYLAPDRECMAWLTPGLPVEVRLPEPPDQLVLPAEAVLIKGVDRRIVYVQGTDGRLRSRDVLVSNASGGWVRVLKGLEPGERVVVKGALLVDGRSEQLL